LLVEVDGSQHLESLSDAARTERLEQQGWRVIGFWNPDIRENLEGVVQLIAHEVEIRLPDGEIVEFVPSRAGRLRTPRTRKKNHP
jgi:very-short-patch-repair endonuclease